MCPPTHVIWIKNLRSVMACLSQGWHNCRTILVAPEILQICFQLPMCNQFVSISYESLVTSYICQILFFFVIFMYCAIWWSLLPQVLFLSSSCILPFDGLYFLYLFFLSSSCFVPFDSLNFFKFLFCHRHVLYHLMVLASSSSFVVIFKCCAIWWS